MIKIDLALDIQRPVEEVFDYLIDPEVLPEWQEGVIEARNETQQPIAVGTKFIDLRKVLGKKVESVVEVTRYEPGHDFDIRTVSGPMTYAAQHHLESVNGGTRLTVHAEGEPSGFFKFAEAVVKTRLQKQIEADFSTLKEILEHRN